MEKNQFPYEVYDEEKVDCALRNLPCEKNI